jgi:prephenate dehydratase
MKKSNRTGEGLVISCLGPTGTFSHTVAMRRFPKAKILLCKTIRDAYWAMQNGRADFCILPSENSSAGEIQETTELLIEESGAGRLGHSLCRPTRKSSSK